jgi:TolB-like protein
VNEFLQRLRERKLVQWALAYVAAAFALIQVLDIIVQRFAWPEQIERYLIVALAIGFFVTVIVAWYHGDRGAQRVSGAELLIIAVVLAIGGAVAWRLGPAPEDSAMASKPPHSAPVPADSKSIAVLPFVNMSGEKDNDYFSDGVSEEILNSLARIDGMLVVGRTSSFQFKGKNEDLRQIGEKLGVAHVLEGSVRREGERARITAQLIRAADGIHLWSQTYDRTLQDTLAVQLDIAEQVAGALNVVLDDRQRERMRAAGVKNVDAFIAYQKGWTLYLDAHRNRDIDLIDGLRLANAEFDKAIVLEKNFSFTHFAKADLYEHILLADNRELTERRNAQQSALDTLERAAATSPDAQQRDFALAERQMLSDDWHGLADRITTAFKQPGCSAPNWTPVFASAFGFGDLIEDAGARATACDPLNNVNLATRLTGARSTGHPERVLAILAEYRERKGVTSSSPVEVMATAMLGHMDEAKRMLASLQNRDEYDYLAAVVVGRLVGEDRASVRARFKDVDRRNSKFRGWGIIDAVEAALFGDRDEVNRMAAAFDARPAGGLLLALLISDCACGAPFDLDATPNFKARLAESGLPWPPTPVLSFPPRPPASSP